MKRTLIAIALAMPAAFAAETGAPQTLTSVTQFRDADPSAPYFSSLQSLTEHYGVSNGFKGLLAWSIGAKGRCLAPI